MIEEKHKKIKIFQENSAWMGSSAFLYVIK